MNTDWWRVVDTPKAEIQQYLRLSDFTSGSYTWAGSPFMKPQQITPGNSTKRHDCVDPTNHQAGETCSMSASGRELEDASCPSRQNGFFNTQPATLSNPATSVNSSNMSKAL